MFEALNSYLRRSVEQYANLQAGKQRKAKLGRRLDMESLETRQLLSGTPEFQVLNDATTNIAYRYSVAGAAQGSYALAPANSAPRGVASLVGVEKTWVVDANRNVYVYNSTGGALLGSWSAGSMANNGTPEGIATDGTDVWIVDSRSDKVFRYAGAASRLSGSQNAVSSFGINSSPKDMVTDGYSLWVVDDSAKTDKVFRYNLDGGWLDGSWTIDAANKAPTGITLDPAGVGDFWISDSGTDRVYKYTAAASRTSGSQAAALSFSLASGNGNSQGLVVPGRPWAEVPHEVEWVRQLGTTGEDVGRAVTTDSAGNIYVTGYVNGSLTEPNPSGVAVPFFAKYDSSGTIQWVQQFAAFAGAPYQGGKIATDDLGNVFLMTGHGGPNAAPVNPSTTLNNFDDAGNLRWSTPLPLVETGAGVAADNLGNAYVATFDATPDSPDNGFEYINLRRFNGTTGDIVWTRRLHVGASPNNTSTVSYDGLGNIYLAAYTSGSLIGPNSGGLDAAVAKYTIDGEFVWARQFGTAAHDNLFQVAADGLGNVFSAGGAFGSLGGPHAGAQDAFVAKHDAAGNLQWIRQLGTTGEEVNAKVWADGLGNVFVATSSVGSLGGPNLGGEDIVIAKYDSAGDRLWAKQLGTDGNEIPSGGGIAGDSLGNLYITGRTSSSWGGPNAGGADIVVIKLSSPPAAATLIAVPDELQLRLTGPAATLDIAAGSVSSPAVPAVGLGGRAVDGGVVSLAREQFFASFDRVRGQYGTSKRTRQTILVDTPADEVLLDGLADTNAMLEEFHLGISHG